ncbi:MAG: Asp-tRNA(Asn)/Glu-tRNA(Gln) amidotransferase GatCAB subunit C [Moraxella sp.]|nr:MAG: Asp-tRNA(Asn)/Glu-tRNA(Gln) amidotransferase GatCAB subunit C [Moraxella sp.]
MTTLTTDDILTCARLSRLCIDTDTAQSYASDLQKILTMMSVLSSVDTDNVAPLANIHESCQPLRPDVADAQIDRDAYQAIAPSVQDGLYLVPQVIE